MHVRALKQTGRAHSPSHFTHQETKAQRTREQCTVTTALTRTSTHTQACPLQKLHPTCSHLLTDTHTHLMKTSKYLPAFSADSHTHTCDHTCKCGPSTLFGVPPPRTFSLGCSYHLPNGSHSTLTSSMVELISASELLPGSCKSGRTGMASFLVGLVNSWVLTTAHLQGLEEAPRWRPAHVHHQPSSLSIVHASEDTTFSPLSQT